MNSDEIRTRFLAFFKKRGHAIIDSASLVTTDEQGVTNPTLFNTAGMQPLIPYLLGKPHPMGQRLADVQKCLRTVDLDEVGDATHATFFEMLGNWSLGDYFKKEAISWSYDFLTSKNDGLGLDPNRLYVTVFEGDSNAPRDIEASTIWQEIFTRNKIDSNRIYFMPASKNWWEAGDSGPCGPDTEMYYDILNSFKGKSLTHSEFVAADNNGQVVEVWNDVFMQYEMKDGVVTGSLAKPSVDTGAGLERLAMVMQNVNNIFETDLLKPIFNMASILSDNIRSQRIIADHIRSAAFLISDGVTPSNTDRGYILRRLIRRAVINTANRKISGNDISRMADLLITTYSQSYPNLSKESILINKTLNNEISKFSEAITYGYKELENLAKKGSISGDEAFLLYSSYGLPIELIVEFANDKKTNLDLANYEQIFTKHQEQSRVGAEKKFKGGLSDANNEMVIRFHTATHLLHQALHDVLGTNISQKGSNITTERLRFDYSHDHKLSDNEKKQVEDIVNRQIHAKLPVNQITLPKSEAEKTGAWHFFGDKYGDQISIYYIGNDIKNAYSKEYCGGPHVRNTYELAGPDGSYQFRIVKEEAVSQGVRRIKAVLE